MDDNNDVAEPFEVLQNALELNKEVNLSTMVKMINLIEKTLATIALINLQLNGSACLWEYCW